MTVHGSQVTTLLSWAASKRSHAISKSRITGILNNTENGFMNEGIGPSWMVPLDLRQST